MKLKLLSIVAVAVLLSSCRKETISTDSDAGKDLGEINVSSQFDWKTTHDVNFSVGISDSRFAGSTKKDVITIYAGDPAKGGRIVSKGAATLTVPFNTKVALPKTLKEVYVVRTAPNGSKVSGVVAVTSDKISVSAGASSIIGAVSGLSTAKSTSSKGKGISLLSETPEAVPSCPSGAGVITISSNQGSYNFEAGKTYSITGNSITINNINQIKGKVYVCATNVTLSGAQLSSGGELYILSGNTVKFNNFDYQGDGDAVLKIYGGATGINNLNVQGIFYVGEGVNLKIGGDLSVKNASTVTNFGNIEVNSNANNAWSIYNHGTLTVKGNYSSNGGNKSNFLNTGTATFNNKVVFTGEVVNQKTFVVTNGEIDFNSAFAYNASGATITAENSKMNNNGEVINDGSVKIKELNNQGSGKITNNCKWWVTTNYNNDGRFDNYSYLRVDGESNMKGTFNLYNSAMFSTDKLISADGIIEGFGTTSLVKVITSSTENVSANGGEKFRGTFEYCDPSRTINPARFDGVAKQGCGVYIPVSSCNEVGNGTPTTPDPDDKPDTDGDGVIDEEDDYPNDPDKAFKHYSVNYNTGGSSIAFEDNWPSKGDYDLNDVVITYRYMVVTNAANKVVRLEADYKLLATGGIFNNGAGIQFNLPAAKAKNFVGSSNEYLESGQDSVVVILFNDSRAEQVSWNTRLGQPFSEATEYAISFDVEDGPSMANFGIGVYNPFIWNNTTGYGRGYETHLLDKAPTNKVNTSLFGTADDNSIAGRKYSTKDNLPFALEIPTAPFRYPIEFVSITKAYLKFAEWASSGGTLYTDWYTNNSPGYVNESFIYTK